MERIMWSFLFILFKFLTLFPSFIGVVNHKLKEIGSEIGAGAVGIMRIIETTFFYYSRYLQFILFQRDQYSGIIFMFVFGIALVMLSFYIVIKLFCFHRGILTSLRFAIYLPLLSQKRFMWNPNQLIFIMLLMFTFVYTMKFYKNISIMVSTFLSSLISYFDSVIAIPIFI